MTSIGPYSQKTDYRNTYDLPDLRGPYPKFKFNVGSIADILDREPTLSVFNYIINLANLKEKFNVNPAYGSYANSYTLIAAVNHGMALVPESLYVNMDIGTARNMIENATLSKSLPKSTLAGGNSASYYLLPEDYARKQSSINRIKVNIFPGPEIYFNGYSRVIGEIEATNGIILLVDNPIVSNF